MGWAARALVSLGAAALAGAAVLAELGEHWWAGDLFAHFRFHYLAIGAALIAAAVLVRPRWLALVVLAACTPHLWSLFAYPTAAQARSPALPTLRVVSINLLFDNTDKPSVARFLRRIKADIVCAQEADASWRRLLASLRADYPYQTDRAAGPEVVLSRHPIVASERRFPSETVVRTAGAVSPFRDLASALKRRSVSSRYSYLTARVRTPGGTVRILCVHPPYGLRRGLAFRQNLHLAAIAIEARASRRPVLVMGDFNLTAYSPRFRTLLAQARLRAADHGLWWPRTWPTPSPYSWVPRYIPGIAIDHILLDPRIAVVTLRRGPNVGSDHFPLIAELQVAPSPGANPAQARREAP
ncbi:MAG: endonuclease/exonuclease/phosphatase family protein [Bauldia litoralis]